MNRLIGRSYRLRIGVGADELVYQPPANIAFRVEVSPGSAGSTAEITLYGVSQETRLVLRNKYDAISLEAGSRGRLGLIFSGEIINAEPGRDGPTHFMRFYCRTTGRQQAAAAVNQSWGPETPQIEIIRQVAQQMLLPIEFIGDFSDLPKAIKGRSISMPAREALNELADAHGFAWYMGANKLTIVRKLPGGKLATRATPPTIISVERGMIGSPQVMLEQVEVRTLLDADIIPGGRIDVRAETRQLSSSNAYQIQYKDPSVGSGIYSVLGVQHVGDYSGNTWETMAAGWRE